MCLALEVSVMGNRVSLLHVRRGPMRKCVTKCLLLLADSGLSVAEDNPRRSRCCDS